MATTSPERGFSVPVVSSDAGLWGGELNNTIGSIDTILGGQLVLPSSVYGQSATLTSSQAQYGQIVIPGSTATFTLTLGASYYAMGNYSIWNQSSAYGVLCQTLSSAGVTYTVPAAQQAIVTSDGTNVVHTNSYAELANVATTAITAEQLSGGYTANQNLNTTSNVTFNEIVATAGIGHSGSNFPGSDACIVFASAGANIDYYASNHVMYNLAGGTIYANLNSNSGWVNGSDVALKENIEPISVLDRLLGSGLAAVSFDWRENGKRDLGIIAQVLRKVFPELVEEITSNGEKLLYVNKGTAGVLALAAITELAERLLKK